MYPNHVRKSFQAGAPSLVKVLKGGYAGDKGAWGTSTFESPIVSGVYERGWRQSFARAGFPGPDEEFAQAQRWLLPVAKGQVRRSPFLD